MPPGVTYHEQQTEAISLARGTLDLSDTEMSDLATQTHANTLWEASPDAEFFFSHTHTPRPKFCH